MPPHSCFRVLKTLIRAYDRIAHLDCCFRFLSVPRIILDILEHFWKFTFDLEHFEFFGTKFAKKLF